MVVLLVLLVAVAVGGARSGRRGAVISANGVIKRVENISMKRTFVKTCSHGTWSQFYLLEWTKNIARVRNKQPCNDMHWIDAWTEKGQTTIHQNAPVHLEVDLVLSGAGGSRHVRPLRQKHLKNVISMTSKKKQSSKWYYLYKTLWWSSSAHVPPQWPQQLKPT